MSSLARRHPEDSSYLLLSYYATSGILLSVPRINSPIPSCYTSLYGILHLRLILLCSLHGRHWPFGSWISGLNPSTHNFALYHHFLCYGDSTHWQMCRVHTMCRHGKSLLRCLFISYYSVISPGNLEQECSLVGDWGTMLPCWEIMCFSCVYERPVIVKGFSEWRQTICGGLERQTVRHHLIIVH